MKLFDWLERLKLEHDERRMLREFHKINNEEQRLARMDVYQLARALEEAQIRKETYQAIVLQQMLAQRIANITSRATIRASWISGAIGFAGALFGAALSYLISK